jgi:uncharacterized protein
MFLSPLMHWDFALILLFFATAVPLLGQRRVRRLIAMPQTTRRDRLMLYASTIVFQWTAVGVILWRVSVHGISAASLGLSVPRPALALTVTILLSALVLTNQLIGLRRLSSHPEASHGKIPQIALKIFPQDGVERAAFFLVVITVASCEELIYRGFAQRVFQDWSAGSTVAAIAGSAALFAVAHLYQGPRGLVTTCIVGLLFSSIRYWTGSLLPTLVAHFITDITAGFLAPSRLRSAQRLAAAVDVDTVA